MQNVPSVTAQERMNAHFHDLMTGLLTHAERDVRLARAAGDMAAHARARARFDTLTAALGIYSAAHLHAHGCRPWPAQARP